MAEEPRNLQAEYERLLKTFDAKQRLVADAKVRVQVLQQRRAEQMAEAKAAYGVETVEQIAQVRLQLEHQLEQALASLSQQMAQVDQIDRNTVVDLQGSVSLTAVVPGLAGAPMSLEQIAALGATR